MMAKSILIERVSNGWIVRPFQPCVDWARDEPPFIAVYQTIEELQDQLPRLLRADEPQPRSLEEAVNQALKP